MKAWGNGQIVPQKVFAYWPQIEYGLIPKNLRADVAIFCFDFAGTSGQTWSGFRKPVSAGVSPVRKFGSSAQPVHCKTAGHYVNSYHARWEVQRKGHDDAILLDEAGNVAEGPISSLFLVKDGVVLTSRLEGVLAGVTRDSAIVVTRDLGIPLEERDIPAAELAAVDEAFYTGTHIRVRPIASIDGRSLGPCPGPVTARVQQALENAYDGLDPRHTDWLDFVE